MRFLSLARVEIGRLLRSRQALLIAVITAFAPLCGYSIYIPVFASVTASARLIANPSLAGGMIGAAVFALFTLLELDRGQKNKTDVLMDAIASPVLLNAARVTGVLCMGALASVAAMTVFLPYTALSMPGIFLLSDYVQAYFLFMLCPVLLGILVAAALYQCLRRVDVGFALFLVLVLVSMSGIVEGRYLLRWINPIVPDMTDHFSNAMLFRMTAYNRLFWFLLFGGICLLSLLGVRRYGRGLAGSFARNIRSSGMLLASGALITCSLLAFVFQPYVDRSPYIPTDTEYIANDNLLLLGTEFDVSLNTRFGTLSGECAYRISNSSGEQQKATLLLCPGYTVESVTANGERVPFTDLKDDTDNIKQVEIELPAAENMELQVRYSGMPRLWTFMQRAMRGPLISGEYVSLQDTRLFPMWVGNEKELGEITGRVTLPKHLAIVSTGDTARLLSESTDGTRTWQLYNHVHTLSFYAGDYVMESLDGGDMPVEFYYSQKHRFSMESLGARDVVERTMTYCTQRFGPLPFTSDRPLKLVQVTSFLHGGQAWDSFSTIGENILSDENLNDPSMGASNAEVLAHEIVHQWWGISAQCMDMEEMDWTDEGITVYVTYRMAKELYGEEYAQKYYVDMWRQAADSRKANFYNRHPEYLDILPERYALDIAMLNEGLGEYDVMPLKILKAEELVGGEEKMDEILAKLFEQSTEEGVLISYDDFLEACGLEKGALDLE